MTFETKTITADINVIQQTYNNTTSTVHAL